jgi:alkylation response protein AidB-like acyl-CoA dehydrogenase
MAIVREHLVRKGLGLHCDLQNEHAIVGNNVGLLLMLEYGTEAQKEKYLKPLVDGKIRSCFSMTEVELPGSNPVMMDTTAVKDGDDYVINGQKWYTSSADGSEFAIVMAVTNPEAGPYLQASMIIVPTDTPGFNLVRNIPVMGHAGEDYFSHAEIL